MPWYPIFLVLVGLAYGNQLLDKRSFRGTNRSPTGLSTVAGSTATNTGSAFQEHLEQARNRNAMPYGAMTVCCDDGMDDILSEKTKIKRDFRVNSHDPSENTLFNNVLSFQDRPTEMVFADSDVTSATTKLDAKVADVVPFAHFDDNYFEDQASREHDEMEKRVGSSSIGCDCKLRNDLLDLGQQHFPRYLLNAVCQTETANDYPQKCRRGTHCKPLEYKVKVLTFRSIRDHTQQDPASFVTWLPDDLRQLWKFRTVSVAAGCFCSY